MFNEIIKQFQDKNPEIKVDMQTLPSANITRRPRRSWPMALRETCSLPSQA